MHTHPYDHRLNRRLTAEDIPSDITMEELADCLADSGCSFYSLDTLAIDAVNARWVRNPFKFRAATQTVPSRGIDKTWEKVGEWKARQPEARRQASILQSACDKLVACAELGDAATITQDEAVLLVQAMAQLKKVWTA